MAEDVGTMGLESCSLAANVIEVDFNNLRVGQNIVLTVKNSRQFRGSCVKLTEQGVHLRDVHLKDRTGNYRKPKDKDHIWVFHRNEIFEIWLDKQKELEIDNTLATGIDFGGFTSGQKLVIAPKNSNVFEANFVDHTKNTIVLENVYYYDGIAPTDVPLTFYRQEIAEISVIGEAEYKTGSGNSRTPNAICLEQEEYERLTEMTRSYIYLNNMHDYKYLDAIDHLSNCENVALAGNIFY